LAPDYDRSPELFWAQETSVAQIFFDKIEGIVWVLAGVAALLGIAMILAIRLMGEKKGKGLNESQNTKKN